MEKGHPGQSLIDVIVALGILLIILAGIAQLTLRGGVTERWSREQTVASLFAQEGMEAVRDIAARNFTMLTVGTHGLDAPGGVYTLAGSANTWGAYQRTVEVASVQRTASGAIVETGGTVDDRTRRVTSRVQWTGRNARSFTLALVGYLTDWRRVLWRITTAAQFTSGSRNSSEVVTHRNGETELRMLGDIDHPQSHHTVDVDGTADIMAIAIDRETDELFLTTANHVSGAELFVYDISNVSAGGVQFLRAAEVGNTSRGLALGSDTIFTLSQDTAKEVRVVRRWDMVVIADWDLTSNAQPNAITIDAAANRVYVGMNKGAGGEFYILDGTPPIPQTPAILAEVDLGKDVKGIAVGLEHAYVITDDSGGELRIINLANVSLQATCDLPGNQLPQDVALYGTRLFLTRDAGPEVEFAEYTIDSTQPRDCAFILGHVLHSVHIGDTPLAFTVDQDINRAFIATASNDENNVVVINMTDNTSQNAYVSDGSMCDAVAFLGAHVYLGCRHNTNTIRVLRGGAGGSGFSWRGTYTSPAFDSGGWASGGTFQALESGNGTITYRIRTAGSEGGLPSARWVGTDGTRETMYSGAAQPIVTDPWASGTRWVQWKAYLTGNGTQTPAIEDVTMTFSPPSP